MSGRARQLRLAPVTVSREAAPTRRTLAAARPGPVEPAPITGIGIECLT